MKQTKSRTIARPLRRNHEPRAVSFHEIENDGHREVGAAATGISVVAARDLGKSLACFMAGLWKSIDVTARSRGEGPGINGASVAATIRSGCRSMPHPPRRIACDRSGVTIAAKMARSKMRWARGVPAEDQTCR